MRLLLILLATIFNLKGHAQHQSHKEVRVTAQTLEGAKIGRKDAARVLRVTIKNNTDSLTSFYEPWNAWGHDAVSIQLNLHDTIYRLWQGCDAWDKNFPSSVMLFPGDSIHFDFGIIGCERYKCGCFRTSPEKLPFPRYNLSGATLKIIYQINEDNHFEEVKNALEKGRKYSDLFFMMFPMSHRKEFSKLSLERKLQSFVIAQLESVPIVLDFDSW